MIKRRIERVAVTLLSAAVLLSSTGIASSLAANEIGTSGSTTAVSASAANSSTTVSQEGGAISSTTIATEGGELVAYNKGSGTVSDPYRISDVTDFVAMQEKVNLTTSANKTLFWAIANSPVSAFCNLEKIAATSNTKTPAQISPAIADSTVFPVETESGAMRVGRSLEKSTVLPR